MIKDWFTRAYWKTPYIPPLVWGILWLIMGTLWLTAPLLIDYLLRL